LAFAVLLVLPLILPGSTNGWSGGMLWLAPLAIVLQSWTLALQYWFIRRKHYRALPTTRIATNVGIVAGQLGLGLLAATRTSLAVGQLAGIALGTTMMALMGRVMFRDIDFGAAARRMWAMAVRYARFPMLVLPSLFLNRGAFYIPTILVGTLYGIEAAGLFALAQRLVGAPVEWMKQGVSQVLYGESSERARNNPAELLTQFHAVTRALLILATVVAVGIALAAEFLITPVFGEQWGDAGRFLQAMALLTPFRAAYASTSQFNAIERQDLYLYWTGMQFVVVGTSLALPHYLGGDAIHAVFWYAAGSAFNYFVLGRMYVRAIHRFLAVRGGGEVLPSPPERLIP
jgi:O-antigen/teichoic acid export membrane protein